MTTYPILRTSLLVVMNQAIPRCPGKIGIIVSTSHIEDIFNMSKRRWSGSNMIKLIKPFQNNLMMWFYQRSFTLQFTLEKPTEKPRLVDHWFPIIMGIPTALDGYPNHHWSITSPKCWPKNVTKKTAGQTWSKCSNRLDMAWKTCS